MEWDIDHQSDRGVDEQTGVVRQRIGALLPRLVEQCRGRVGQNQGSDLAGAELRALRQSKRKQWDERPHP